MTKSHSFPPCKATKGGLVGLTRAFPPFGGIIGGLLLFFVACRKETPDPPPPPPPVAEKPDTLPPMTTTGANTFGCKVNGKIWVAKADWRSYLNPAFQLFDAFINEKNTPPGGFLQANRQVYLGDKDWDAQLFQFGLRASEGTYPSRPLGTVGNAFSVYYRNENTLKWYYATDNKIDSTNQLVITKYDPDNNILSGTFHFKLFRGEKDKITDRKDSLVITDGRFDIIYSN